MSTQTKQQQKGDQLGDAIHRIIYNLGNGGGNSGGSSSNFFSDDRYLFTKNTSRPSTSSTADVEQLKDEFQAKGILSNTVDHPNCPPDPAAKPPVDWRQGNCCPCCYSCFRDEGTVGRDGTAGIQKCAQKAKHGVH